MKITVAYSRDALKQLKKLERVVSRRIVLKIAEYTKKNPLQKAKALQGDLTGKYRYRIGSYRAIFILDESGNLILLTILDIKHRKDIYK